MLTENFEHCDNTALLKSLLVAVQRLLHTGLALSDIASDATSPKGRGHNGHCTHKVQRPFSYVLNSRPTLLFLPLPPSHQSRKAYSRFVTRMMANHISVS